ncbi:MAG: hypothetical protein FJX89_07465 [Bacteroidetes bacterium]|nr:hypothetical protein [Bacteroidota bacterium]
MSEDAIEREVALLNRILFTVESAEKLSHCCECIDLNRRRLHHSRKQILLKLREHPPKPFVFLLNLN